MSVPAIISAALVWLLVDEVKRGLADKQPRTTNNEPCNDRAVEMRMLDTKDQEIHNDRKSMRVSHETSNTKRQPFNNDFGAYAKLDNQPSTTLCDSSLSGPDGSCCYRSHMYDHYLKPHMVTLKALFSCHSVLLLMFQGAPGCIPWGIINTYLNDFLSSDRGMSVEVCAGFVLCVYHYAHVFDD